MTNRALNTFLWRNPAFIAGLLFVQSSQAQEARSYLHWANKPQTAPAAYANTHAQAPISQSPISQSPISQASYIPSSPYGQVGDPFTRSLSWPAKATTQRTSVAPHYASSNATPPQTYAQPIPSAAPNGHYPSPRISPEATYNPYTANLSGASPLQSPSKPSLSPEQEAQLWQEDQTDHNPALSKPAQAPMVPQNSVTEASRAQPSQAPYIKKAPTITKAPTKVPVPPKLPAAPYAESHPADEGYAIPKSSKYYRGQKTQRPPAKEAIAPVPKQTETNSRDTLSQAEDALPEGFIIADQQGPRFVPGGTVTDEARQAPRRYSLHRQYGMAPDTITPSRETTSLPDNEQMPLAPANTPH